MPRYPTRTILDPRPPAAGAPLSSVDALVGPGQSIVLAQWQGPKGGAPCTVYVSRATGQVATFTLPQQVQLTIEHQTGSVRRAYTQPFPNAGLTRRISAEQIRVVATNTDTAASYRLGASIQNGMVSLDRFPITLADPSVGVFASDSFFPHGCGAWRARTFNGSGSIYFCVESTPGLLTPFEGPYPANNFNSWSAVPSSYAGVSFDGAAFDALCMIEWEI